MKKRRGNAPLDFPRDIARRILERGARGERRLVLVLKGGQPRSVWGFEEYLDRQERTKKVKPWRHRKVHEQTDPLGAIDAEPPRDLSRESMYEEEG
jgi:hypothetical protein